MFKRTLRNLFLKESKLFVSGVVLLIGAAVPAVATDEPYRGVFIGLLVAAASLALFFAVVRSAWPANAPSPKGETPVSAPVPPQPRQRSAFILGDVGHGSTVVDNYTEGDVGIEGNVDGHVSGNVHRPRR